MRRRRGRRAIAVAAGAVVTVAMSALVGCSPDPQPSPTPTAAFASEEEAFAAAEEVYRAYNDALNAAHAGDSTARPDQYLTGLALKSDLDAERFAENRNLSIVGEGKVVRFSGESAEISASDAAIEARVCLDVSDTHVVNGSGLDVTPADRPIRLPLAVSFTGSADLIQISNSTLIEGEKC